MESLDKLFKKIRFHQQHCKGLLQMCHEGGAEGQGGEGGHVQTYKPGDPSDKHVRVNFLHTLVSSLFVFYRY